MPRPRPRLRSRTGCVHCLEWRKKCDEIHPTCGLCRRHQVQCVWRNLPASTKTSIVAAADTEDLKSLLFEARDDSSDGQQAQRLLMNTALCSARPSEPMLAGSDQPSHPLAVIPGFLSKFVTPMSKKAYQNPSPWLSSIMGQEWARDSISVWGLCFMSLKRNDTLVPCFKKYGSAVSGLRQALQENNVMLDARTVFIASYFLGLFEALWSKHTSEQMYHWSAISRMLLLYGGSSILEDEGVRCIYDVVTETAMYNITNNVIFCRSLDVPKRLWSEMDLFFQRSGIDSDSDCSRSPLLAGRRDIYHLIFDIFWLCRQDLSTVTSKRAIERCLIEQENMARSVDIFYSHEFPTSTIEVYLSRHRIQISTLRLVLLKLANPSFCSSNPEIASVRAASFFAIVNQFNRRNLLMSDGLSWPLLVLLCAAENDEQFESILEITENFIPIMAPGLQYRMRKARDHIRSQRGKSGSRCNIGHTGICSKVHDGLNLLIQEDGIFSS